MQLSGWQRLGTVLSIVWALGAGIHTHNAGIESADNFAQFSNKVCSDGKSLAHDADLSSCNQERDKNLETWMKGSNANVAIAALAPIPIGWLAGFILLYVGRAQIVGFCAVVPWSTLNMPKKAVVAFCTVVSFASILFGLTEIMNLYVDAQVPVGLSPFIDVTTNGEAAFAKGTWMRDEEKEGSTMHNPIQTSEIKCVKDKLRCTEARASISSVLGSHGLETELIEYEVESWTIQKIVMRRDFSCATEVFTIDFTTQSVNGGGYATKKDNEDCKVYGGKEEHWNYRLVKGFPIYWEQRKKPDHCRCD